MKPGDEKLEYFDEVKVQKPSDVIISQIRTLISQGKLKPGDKLPSERTLVERFGVGRGQVREGLKRLEFFGILRTEPNKGTVVASLGGKALEGLISSILQFDRDDLRSLFETRAVLEVESARLAALRGTDAAIAAIRQAHFEFSREVESGMRALEEDHIFHLKIAEATQNAILGSFISLLTPDVIKSNRGVEDRDNAYRGQALSEHTDILRALENRDSETAANAMRQHMLHAQIRRFGETR